MGMRGQKGAPRDGATVEDYAPMVAFFKKVYPEDLPTVDAMMSWPYDTGIQMNALVSGYFNGSEAAFHSMVNEAFYSGHAIRNANPTKYSATLIKRRVLAGGGKSWPALDKAEAKEAETAARYNLKWPPA